VNSVRRAVIDVGTNSVKLLVAELDSASVRPLFEESHQTRLGEGFFENKRLQPGAIAKTASAVAAFASKARELSSASVRVIATSAARDAVNGRDLTSAIEQASGLRVQIISGEQEAEWAFQGVRTDPELADCPLLLLDLGGGSTEIIAGRGDHTSFRQSFPLGTVRLLNALPHGDPPTQKELVACRRWLREFLNREVAPDLEPALQHLRQAGAKGSSDPVQCVGTGGTASILGCMEAQLTTFDRAKLESTRLSLERLSWHVERLWSLPLEQRKEIVGLPKNRADVILPGAAIYEAVLEQFGFEKLRVSTRGLRFAALLTSD
jgi:exopolyphosphatase / guanosine-5'-triphosphate,3'-diphosphate pyrophosphatase